MGATKYSKEWISKVRGRRYSSSGVNGSSLMYVLLQMDAELGNPKGDLRPYSYENLSRRGREHLLARERDHFSHYILRLAYCHQVR